MRFGVLGTGFWAQQVHAAGPGRAPGRGARRRLGSRPRQGEGGRRRVRRPRLRRPGRAAGRGRRRLDRAAAGRAGAAGHPGGRGRQAPAAGEAHRTDRRRRRPGGRRGARRPGRLGRLLHLPLPAGDGDLAGTGGRTPLAGGRLLAGLAGRFAFRRSPWRDEYGALWDIGPHALSLFLPTLGPGGRRAGRWRPRRHVHLVLHHESGAASTRPCRTPSRRCRAASSSSCTGTPAGSRCCPKRGRGEGGALGRRRRADRGGSDGWCASLRCRVRPRDRRRAGRRTARAGIRLPGVGPDLTPPPVDGGGRGGGGGGGGGRGGGGRAQARATIDGTTALRLRHPPDRARRAPVVNCPAPKSAPWPPSTATPLAASPHRAARRPERHRVRRRVRRPARARQAADRARPGRRPVAAGPPGAHRRTRLPRHRGRRSEAWGLVGTAHGDGGRPALVLQGHVDVVPPGDLAAWRGDPFEPTWRGTGSTPAAPAT